MKGEESNVLMKIWFVKLEFDLCNLKFKFEFEIKKEGQCEGKIWNRVENSMLTGRKNWTIAWGNVGLVKPKESWSVLIKIWSVLIRHCIFICFRCEQQRKEWEGWLKILLTWGMGNSNGTTKKLISERDMRKRFKILRIL